MQDAPEGLEDLAPTVARAGLVPSLFVPSVLGDQGAREAWRRVERFLQNPLPLRTRIALVCAAFEGPRGTTSPMHATGATLVGHADGPIDLGTAWDRLSASDGGAALLRTTQRIAHSEDPEPGDLREARAHLGAWQEAWEELLDYAVWCEAVRRVHAERVRPCAHPSLDGWLAQVVQARAGWTAQAAR